MVLMKDRVNKFYSEDWFFMSLLCVRIGKKKNRIVCAVHHIESQGTAPKNATSALLIFWLLQTLASRAAGGCSYTVAFQAVGPISLNVWNLRFLFSFLHIGIVLINGVGVHTYCCLFKKRAGSPLCM